MSNTLREIVKEVYDVLGEEDSSTIFDKDNTVIPNINKEMLNVCRWNVRNFFTKSMMRSGMLGFLYQEQIVKIPRPKKLLADAAIWATTLSLSDLDDLPDSWFLCIFGMFVEYSITWWVLTLTNALTVAVKEWEIVRFAIQKPLESIQFKDVREYPSNNKLEYYDFQNKPIMRYRAYTVKPQWEYEYLVFDEFSWMVIVPYILKPEPLEDLDDVCILPDNYWTEVVARLVAWQLLMDDSQVQKWQNVLLKAYDSLTSMYNFYSEPLKDRRRSVKVRPITLDMY